MINAKYIPFTLFTYILKDPSESLAYDDYTRLWNFRDVVIYN